MKDTFYFSHDYSARSDVKIKKLIQRHGMSGYGLFWAIIEDLYQNENSMPIEYDTLSFEYRVDESLIKSVINDFNLFVFDDNCFGSLSIQKRIDERNKKSDKARESAKTRWGECETRTTANNCILYFIEIYNEEESFIKVGITSNSVSRRYSGKLNGYSYKLIWQIDLEVEKSLEIETKITNLFKKYEPKINFPGSLECIDNKEYDEIVDFVMRNYNFVMQGYVFRNTIKESKGKEIKEIKEKKEDEIKVILPKAKSFKQFTEEDFKEDLKQYLNTYKKEMLIEFYNYWSEKSSTGLMRFQLGKTWETERRLMKWYSNEKAKIAPGGKKPTENDVMDAAQRAIYNIYNS